MLKIRFRCAGRIHLPHYRIVVTEASTKRDGKYLDLLGNYDPLKKILHLPNFEKVQDWIQKGAQPTTSVARLLLKNGVILKTKYKKK